MASPDFIAENIRAGGADAIFVLQHRSRAAHRHKGGQWSRVAILPQIGNGADRISDIEGKVARVATSKLGNERVSITRHGQRTTGYTTWGAGVRNFGLRNQIDYR